MQSSRLCTTRGLHKTPHAKTITLNTPLFRILTHSHSLWHLTPFRIRSWSPLWTLDLLAPLLILYSFRLSTSLHIGISPIKLRLHRWNLQFCHLAGSGPANLLFLLGNPESDFLCHSIGQVVDGTRIPAGSPTTISLIDWVLGSTFSQNRHQHEAKTHPLSKDTFRCRHPFQNPPTLSRTSRTSSPVTPWKPPRSNPH